MGFAVECAANTQMGDLLNGSRRSCPGDFCILLYNAYFAVPAGARATVQSIDGTAYAVTDAGARRISPRCATLRRRSTAHGGRWPCVREVI